LTTKETPKPSRAASVAVGAELELTFSDLLANGQAVGRADGIVIFCFGPLPAERAHVRVSAVKQKYAVAEMLELLVTSPERAQPFCPVFGACGGCQVQHLSYAAQLTWKQNVVHSALVRIGGFTDVAVRPTIGMEDPRAYRNKMSLVVEHRGPIPTIGFYQQRTHDVVPIDACPVVAPQLSAFIGRFNAARTDAELAPALTDAKHIVARTARTSGESVVTITTSTPSEGARIAAPALLAELPGAVGITNSFDLSSENAILGRRHASLIGDSTIEERIGEVRYRVSAESFFQVNVEIVQKILTVIGQYLAPSSKIVDLYCGAGTFSLFFAKHGAHVLGIEENPQAVSEARTNAALNELQSRASFEVGRVEDAVRGAEPREALRRAGVVFLDPPRKGSDDRTLSALAEAGVPEVWYLSCDPATLARDLKFLAAKGYDLGLVQPFDMFPQTGHVETLVTLVRHRTATS
jgi:23S rRNA (uracil1939-C5)-methyltransferase